MGSHAAKEELLRKKILEIQQNASLNDKEKTKEIQSLFTSTRKGSEENVATSPKQELKATYYNEKKGILGCQHYSRKVRIQAVCCGEWFTCRLCHDEASDHPIDRTLTQKMSCMVCFRDQPVGKTCTYCNEEMAAYYCGICKLWDNSPNKSIYHCDDCGICRVGKGLGIDYQHCKKCCVCLSIGMFKSHRCIENSFKSDCPICKECLFTSRKTVRHMPCGHMIHSSCQRRLMQSSYQCPICSKSLGDMTRLFHKIDQYLKHSLPEEFSKQRRHIVCCDCEQRSIAKYHFLYHKCGHCGSYSTKILDTFDAEDLAFSHLGDIPPHVNYQYSVPAFSNLSDSADQPNLSNSTDAAGMSESARIISLESEHVLPEMPQHTSSILEGSLTESSEYHSEHMGSISLTSEDEPSDFESLPQPN